MTYLNSLAVPLIDDDDFNFWTPYLIVGLQANLKKVLDVGNRRLEMLHQKHKPTYQAVLWLRANMHRFKATIHEPIMLQVSWSKQQHNLQGSTLVGRSTLVLAQLPQASRICKSYEPIMLQVSSSKQQHNLQGSTLVLAQLPRASRICKSYKPIMLQVSSSKQQHNLQGSTLGRAQLPRASRICKSWLKGK